MEIVKEYIINLSIIFLGTLITMTTYSKKPLSNKQILIRHVIHYTGLSSALMGSAYIFKWIDFNQTKLVIGLIAIFIVSYIGISGTFNFLEKREVDYIN